MLRRKSINDCAQFFEIDTWINRTVKHLQVIFEWFQQQVIVDKVWVSQYQRRCGWRMFVEVVQPVHRVSKS